MVRMLSMGRWLRWARWSLRRTEMKRLRQRNAGFLHCGGKCAAFGRNDSSLAGKECK